MATANIKDVKRRIKSVESTMQITKAMELVASSKLRKAKEKAIQSQPYFNTLYKTLKNISLNTPYSPVNSEIAEKKALLVVIAGDRGLAGGFNHNVLKLAAERIESLESDGYKISVMPVGKKSVEYFTRHTYDIYHQLSQVAEKISVYDCLDISDDIVLKYSRGEFARVEICYTTFANTLSQIPKNVQVFPFEVKAESDKPEASEEEKKQKYKPAVVYDPSPQEVLKLLLPKYFGGLLYGAIVDSYACEQAARRTAMESASDNAQEMIDNLSLLYNRARQAQITQELTEIVSGSMKKSD